MEKEQETKTYNKILAANILPFIMKDNAGEEWVVEYNPEEGAKTFPLPSFIITNIKTNQEIKFPSGDGYTCIEAEQACLKKETQFMIDVVSEIMFGKKVVIE
jgi:hypothetical protein